VEPECDDSVRLSKEKGHSEIQIRRARKGFLGEPRFERLPGLGQSATRSAAEAETFDLNNLTALARTSRRPAQTPGEPARCANRCSRFCRPSGGNKRKRNNWGPEGQGTRKRKCSAPIHRAAFPPRRGFDGDTKMFEGPCFIRGQEKFGLSCLRRGKNPRRCKSRRA
jgi:hypothetical protein